MVLLAKSVYYKCFLKIKKNIHGINNIKKHVFYRKIKHIKYVLNNYGLSVTHVHGDREVFAESIFTPTDMSRMWLGCEGNSAKLFTTVSPRGL